MKSKRPFAALLAATALMSLVGCASNQAIKTTDGKTHCYRRQAPDR